MAKRNIESELFRLGSLRSEPLTEQSLETLRRALADRVNVIVARAAGTTVALQARALVPDLLAAYDRLFETPTKRDPQCWGKEAIAKALKDFEYTEADPFLRGARHHQWEPVYGGEADSAANLRATCLLALPFCMDILRDGKLWQLMRGLTDKAAPVRLEAIRALEQLGGFEAALLLRLKARMPERDLSVTGQVFESLLALEGNGAIPFVVESITQRGETERDPELAEQAALALGASRIPEALDTLTAFGGQSLLVADEVIFRALSASRTEQAFEYLLRIVRAGRERDASTALYALQLHRDSEELSARVRQMVAERSESGLVSLVERLFPRG